MTNDSHEVQSRVYIQTHQMGTIKYLHIIKLIQAIV